MAGEEKEGVKEGKAAVEAETSHSLNMGLAGTSDVQSGLAFTPALRAHQRAQGRNGANRGQQHEAGDEEESTLHIVHRERSHDVTPFT